MPAGGCWVSRLERGGDSARELEAEANRWWEKLLLTLVGAPHPAAAGVWPQHAVTGRGSPGAPRRLLLTRARAHATPAGETIGGPCVVGAMVCVREAETVFSVRCAARRLGVS